MEVVCPGYQHVKVLLTKITTLGVKHKRHIYLIMRHAGDSIDHHTFFPAFGFTAGEFALGQIISSEKRAVEQEENERCAS